MCILVETMGIKFNSIRFHIEPSAMKVKGPEDALNMLDGYVPHVDPVSKFQYECCLHCRTRCRI